MKHKHLFPALLAVCWYLGSYQGHTALFRNAETHPVTVFPYRIALYPQADQDALRRGIAVDSQEALTQLLEDYFS